MAETEMDQRPNPQQGNGRAQGARILIVDDQPANLDVLRHVLETQGYRVMLAPGGEVALRSAQRGRPDLILLDVVMPDLNGYEVCRRLKQDEATAAVPVIFITANDDTESLVKGFHVGAVDYVGKPFRDEEVLMRVRTHLEIARLTGELAARNRELAEHSRRLEEEVALRRLLKSQLSELTAEQAKDWGLEGLIAESAAMQRVMERVHDLQGSAAHALLSGEPGTGKELVARAIHYGSARSAGPFVAIDGADLPRDVVGSMDSRSRALSVLFGHAAGAFPGADSQREGCFQLADGGTLFVDHIGSVPPPIQASLLRALDVGRARRLGEDAALAVSVRLLAACEEGPDDALAQGRLHAQLHGRLRDTALALPPLRERRADIPGLVRHFAGQLSRQLGREPAEVSQEAVALLAGQDWPGNVRQLRGAVERALVSAGGRRLEAGHLGLEARPAPAAG